MFGVWAASRLTESACVAARRNSAVFCRGTIVVEDCSNVSRVPLAQGYRSRV
jgi:hypothetical protein